jgi:hypothetical protein
MRFKDYVPLWVIPLVMVLAVGTVWLRLSIVRTTYAVSETDRALQGLRQEQEKTELRLAGLRSPKRLEALAKQRYGLAQPRLDQVVNLK